MFINTCASFRYVYLEIINGILFELWVTLTHIQGPFPYMRNIGSTFIKTWWTVTEAMLIDSKTRVLKKNTD